MSEESPSLTNDFASDLEAFHLVAAQFQRLDHAARLRLLRTISTFFNLDSASSLRESTIPISSSEPAPLAAFSEDRTPSPKDFMRDKKPKSDVERVATLAYYLTYYRNLPYFKTVDLSQLNTEAAQVKLSNAAQAVDNATKAGLLVQASKGAKQLSAHGELYVQALPDRIAAKEAVADARPKRRRRTVSGSEPSTGKPSTREEGK